MRSQCSCGQPILKSTDELGCVECSEACCPSCAMTLESVWYCPRCADALLGAA